jgi:hypothetical protein
MIGIAYKKRDGLDWFRMFRLFKDDEKMKSIDKAKSFISHCIEQNSKSKRNPKYQNFIILVGGKRISKSELLEL